MSILILAFTDLSSDPRVRRQIIALKDTYKIMAVGNQSPQIDGVRFLPCKVWKKSKAQKLITLGKLLTRKYESLYWQSPIIKDLEEKLETASFDLIIANDIETLPLAVKLAKKHRAKVILDAHEYAPREFEDVLYWKLFYKPYKTYLCRKYMPKADSTMTVCDGIAKEYLNKFGISCTVVTNACAYAENVNAHVTHEEKIKMVFHGAATSSRKLENIIEIMNLLDERFYLDFYLVGDQKYIQNLRKMSKGNKHIQFMEPVRHGEILNMLRQYDIGLYLLEPNSFNNRMALPNKLFEFIQARLMIAIGPSPEMSKYVKKYQCGIVADDFKPQTLANELNQLTIKEIQLYKANAEKMAREECAEKNRDIILKMVKKTVEEEV